MFEYRIKVFFLQLNVVGFHLLINASGIESHQKKKSTMKIRYCADITWRNGMEDCASEIWIVKTITDPLVFNATNFDEKKKHCNVCISLAQIGMVCWDLYIVSYIMSSDVIWRRKIDRVLIKREFFSFYMISYILFLFIHLHSHSNSDSFSFEREICSIQ